VAGDIRDKYILLYKYLEDKGVIESNIESFNYFVDHEMTKVGRAMGFFSPRVLPQGLHDLKFKIERLWLSKADFMEKEGIIRIIYPNEARIRNITYSGTVFMEFSVYENESFKNKYQISIGKLPIMVRSKYCNTYGLSPEELIKIGEDPYDFGGYFIINGSEKVLVLSEELSTDKFFVQEESGGVVKYKGFLLSESLVVQYPHNIEMTKDSLLYVSFEKYKRIPLIPLLKVLGMDRDDEIYSFINEDDNFEETYINLLEYQDLQTQDDVIKYLADKLRLTGSFEVKREKLYGIIDTKLLPHVGTSPNDRMFKAYILTKYARKILLLAHGIIGEDVKDHLKNKVVRTPGDLIRDLFRVVLKTFVQDAMSQYDRLARRGKIPSYTSIFRAKVFTDRFQSAFATGKWTRNRVGVSQQLDRTNRLSVLSHLTRVWSSIEGEAELYEARMVHGTHWGRLDMIETPEGKETGLRKNLTLFAKISFEEIDINNFISQLEKLGLKSVKNKNFSRNN